MKIVVPIELTVNKNFAWPEKTLNHIKAKQRIMKAGKKLCTIEDYEKAIRHIGQNNLHWKRAGILSKATGSTPEEILRICMQRIFEKTGNPKFGKYIKLGNTMEYVRATSTRLTISEYSLIMKEQDIIADILNEELEYKITLPTKEKPC